MIWTVNNLIGHYLVVLFSKRKMLEEKIFSVMNDWGLVTMKNAVNRVMQCGLQNSVNH
jgi:hypothetical protein